MSEWITVAKAGEIAPGGHRVVDADGAHIAVFNLGGKYYAIEDVCTHDGGELAGGCVIGEEIESHWSGNGAAGLRTSRVVSGSSAGRRDPGAR